MKMNFFVANNLSNKVIKSIKIQQTRSKKIEMADIELESFMLAYRFSGTESESEPVIKFDSGPESDVKCEINVNYQSKDTVCEKLFWNRNKTGDISIFVQSTKGSHSCTCAECARKQSLKYLLVPIYSSDW